MRISKNFIFSVSKSIKGRAKSWKGQMKWNLNDCILGGVCWTTYFHLIAHSSGQTMLFPLGWLAKNAGLGSSTSGGVVTYCYATKSQKYLPSILRPTFYPSDFWMALSLGNVYPIFGCASKWKSEKSFMNFVGFCFDCDNTWEAIIRRHMKVRSGNWLEFMYMYTHKKTLVFLEFWACKPQALKGQLCAPFNFCLIFVSFAG